MANIKLLSSKPHCDDIEIRQFQKDLSELISKMLQGKESVIKEVTTQIFGEASPENVSQLTFKAQQFPTYIERVKDFDLPIFNDEYVYHNDVFIGTISYPKINGRLNIMFTPNEQLKAATNNG